MRLFASIAGLVLLAVAVNSVQAQQIPFDPPAEKQYRVMRFGAKWCAPCKVYNERFGQGVSDYCKEIKVQNYYYDLDRPGNRGLFDRLQLKSVPALVLVEVLKDGKIRPVKRWGGQNNGDKMLSVEELKRFVDPSKEGPHRALPLKKEDQASAFPYQAPQPVFYIPPQQQSTTTTYYYSEPVYQYQYQQQPVYGRRAFGGVRFYNSGGGFFGNCGPGG